MINKTSTKSLISFGIIDKRGGYMKILAFDIDGTSVTPLSRVHDETLAVLHEMAQAGYYLVPTTGRSLDSIPNKIMEMGNLDFAITSNGSRITNLRTKIDLHEDCLTPSKAKEVLDIIHKHRVLFNIHAHGTCYDANRFGSHVRGFFFNNDFTKQAIVKNFSEFVINEAVHVEKIQIFSFSKMRLAACIEDLNLIEGISFPMSHNHYLEVTTQSVNKGSALQILMKYLDVDPNDVVVIGNDTNDIAMFEVAGTKIAMDNSREILKDKADFVGESNRNDGFASSLRKYILNRR